MLICLSPNGRNSYTGEERVTRMLVGTANGVSIVERVAGGWRGADLKLPGLHVSSLLVEPVRGGIFAGMHFGKGLYFSPDGGATWEKRTQGLTIEDVYLLNSVATGGKVTLYAGTEPASLFRSDDYGMTWRELPTLKQVPGTDKWDFPAPPHVAHVKSLQIDPRDPRTIFAGVEQGGLFKSVDGGESWRELDDYSTPEDAVYKDIHRCVFRPSNPDEMYMSSGCGLYYSKDRGETWDHVTGRNFRIGYPDQLLFSPRDDRTMFLAGSARPRRLACLPSRQQHGNAQPRRRSELGAGRAGIARIRARQHRGDDHRGHARRGQPLRRDD